MAEVVGMVMILTMVSCERGKKVVILVHKSASPL